MLVQYQYLILVEARFRRKRILRLSNSQSFEFSAFRIISLFEFSDFRILRLSNSQTSRILRKLHSASFEQALNIRLALLALKLSGRSQLYSQSEAFAVPTVIEFSPDSYQFICPTKVFEHE